MGLGELLVVELLPEEDEQFEHAIQIGVGQFDPIADGHDLLQAQLILPLLKLGVDLPLKLQQVNHLPVLLTFLQVGSKLLKPVQDLQTHLLVL